MLVGFMGAGKSTVGPLLAEELGWGFVDLDDLVERREGRPVPEILRERGEPAFRAAELRAAQEASGLTRHVVAAGGGAFAQDETRAVLRRGAVTVWLRCDFDVLAARVGTGLGRPLASSRETMRATLRTREPFYNLADLVVDSSTAAPGDLAQHIARAAGASRSEGAPGR